MIVDVELKVRALCTVNLHDFCISYQAGNSGIIKSSGFQGNPDNIFVFNDGVLINISFHQHTVFKNALRGRQGIRCEAFKELQPQQNGCDQDIYPINIEAEDFLRIFSVATVIHITALIRTHLIFCFYVAKTNPNNNPLANKFRIGLKI